jgi:ABC-type sugar transport system ATPase subunit
MIQSLSIQSMLETIEVRTGAERRKALLGVRGLRKRFGGRLLFDIGCLEIATHGAYALTGANGVGKSTLLRVLGGLEPAEIDSLRFEGADVRTAPYPRALRKAIVYVHQHPLLFSTSVAHNIGYGLQVRGVTGAALAGAVDAAIEWAGVGHRQRVHHILHRNRLDPIAPLMRRDDGAVGLVDRRPFRRLLAHQRHHRHADGVRQVHHGGFHRDDQVALGQHGRQLEEVLVGAEQFGAVQLALGQHGLHAPDFLRHRVDDEAGVAPFRLGAHGGDQLGHALDRPAALAGLGEGIDEDQLALAAIEAPLVQAGLGAFDEAFGMWTKGIRARRDVDAGQLAEPFRVHVADVRRAAAVGHVRVQAGVQLAVGEVVRQADRPIGFLRPTTKPSGLMRRARLA